MHQSIDPMEDYKQTFIKLLKDADDFIKVANVKEHFISKIKSMIVIGEPKKADNGDDDDQGRIVDI